MKAAIEHLIEHMVTEHPERFAGLLLWETGHTIGGGAEDDYDHVEYMDGYEEILLHAKDTLDRLDANGHALFSMYNFLPGFGSESRRRAKNGPR